MKRDLLAAAFLLSCLPVGPALAQTPFTPPPASDLPPMPVSDDVVRQAEQQAEGQFGAMRRARIGGQIQEAWSRSEEGSAVFEYKACARCTYKVRLREQMVTVLELPDGEMFKAADLGDSAAFKVEARSSRLIAVKPLTMGMDTNLVVYGTSGAVYPFYLRAEAFNSENITDFVVRLVGGIEKDGPDIVGPAASLTQAGSIATTAGASDLADAVQGLKQTDPGTVPGDYVQEAKFDPDKLRGWGEYELWGDEELKPETVFRDDYFTYIRFGSKWKDVELPTAYVTVDGIDELVNTRIEGATYIIESTQRLITLKSGTKFMCVRYPEGLS
ncbi:TrbG/VirB9 family P-type conjugative transfer protein [Rhodospirillaceae bacterium KN72]|uniref:TrbG/VirB9 family P-type conjugative transfer protein n=1 Tax=Pacificispira spongiicola TaxID=2729598 RepID=A0A7Y0HH98_9PROT|nr:TrbG/VirB9 family P-type conjugative transfer protein [Pacificispira spongiicola]NMM46493.1 TrbG/VirB9 family P-type conjugative transfer protein [Pacificispira spongiicola]